MKIKIRATYLALKLWLLFCWTWFILALTATPVKEREAGVFSITDKVAHAVLFGVFAYLTAIVMPKKKNHQKYYILLIFIISFFYAYLIEYLQIFIPGRDASGFDLLAGALGILIGLTIYYAKNRIKKT